jgi:hypothetical protein
LAQCTCPVCCTRCYLSVRRQPPGRCDPQVFERYRLAGFREIKEGDFAKVTELLNAYLSKYQLHQVFTEAEVTHFLTPKQDLVYVYVVEDDKGVVTDVCSFYCLPSSILNHHEHKELRAAYMCDSSAWAATTLQALTCDLCHA